ncbi:MAG: hypothetical protein PHD97_08705 [Bacteroidales bacterium]|nr:hypothetical protein [Bacteroidales bacterium]
MQIDFHHAAVYVLARLAGFTAGESDIISYASQYVDDAKNEGVIKFKNGAKYSKVSSSHKAINLHNANAVQNQRVWVPFHFLPGNGGMTAGTRPPGGFINKLVCFPNSFVAQEMLDKCIADSDKPYALHRLGVTMHVLADTFSHQGFAGVVHDINDISELEIDGKIKKHNWFKKLFVKIKSYFVGAALPLGHGAALTYPDLPYLKWRYVNKLNQDINRNNILIFNDAVKSIFESLIKYKNKNAVSIIKEQIPKKDLEQIKFNIINFTGEDGELRHRQWLETIAEGKFSFGKENISYAAKGKGSWKYMALNTECENDTGEYEYSDNFLSSNWKLFHDALQKHQFELVHDILPKYGICVA